MDDIASLFASLAAAQTQQVAQRLMERNIVDLVQKLRDQGLQLYPTKDGKEYVTPDQVEREIAAAISTHGGRMLVRSLDDELNMAQEIVDSTLDRLVVCSRGKMRVMEGEIISSAYLDTVCEEINSELVEAGELKIGDLARKHRLTVADMENALASRLGTFVHGRVERQVLFTPAFIQKQTATIIGALTAATRPTSTLDIIQRFRLQPELFETTLKQLMDSGRIKGVYSGKRFTPHSFIQAQSRAIAEFFQSNKCISWVRVEALQVTLPAGAGRIEQRWTTSAFSSIRALFPPESIAVNCGVVSPAFLQQLESTAAALLTSQHCVDISTLVPDDFLSDTDAFVQRMPQLLADGNMLLRPSDDADGDPDAVILLSGAWLQRVRDAILAHSVSVGAHYAKLLSAAAVAAPASVESKGKKDKGRAAAAAAASAPVDDVIDVELEFSRAIKGLGAAVDELAWRWTRQTLLQFVKSSIISAARSAQQGAPVVSHKALAANYCEAMHGLQATLNGISALPLDAKAKDMITKFAVKALGGNVLNIMVHALADPVLVSSVIPAGSHMTAEARTKILQKSSASDEMTKVEAANKAVAKGVPSDCLEAIEVAAESLEFRVKPLDAKAERAMLQKAKEELQQQLSSCGAEDADSALVIGTQLAAAIFRSCVIAVPKNCVSAVLSALAQPRDASASPPSPAYEEATAALKALESLGDAPAAPAVLRVKHSLADITSLRA